MLENWYFIPLFVYLVYKELFTFLVCCSPLNCLSFPLIGIIFEIKLIL